MRTLFLGIIAAMVASLPLWAQQSDTGNRAIFAAGCFWCVEEAFEKTPGVLTAVSGFAGGQLANPSYQQVTFTETGHAEVVQVTWDPALTNYRTLLNIFWRNVDAIDGGGQFCDRGSSYRPALFPLNDAQTALAEASKDLAQERLGRDIAVTIETETRFYPAEDYHQDYYAKNPLRYGYYKWACGRAARLEALWGAEPKPLFKAEAD